MMIICLSAVAHADTVMDGDIIRVCPPVGIQARTAEFDANGIILTYFDSTALWVYDVATDRRYPLPDSNPCTTNCRLSPDARWITYFNDATNAYNRMRLNGTERTLITAYAADVEWWSDEMYLIWTPARSAYLRPLDADVREYLTVPGVVSVQPGGRYAVLLQQDGDTFSRTLVNLAEPRERVLLGEDRAYYNTQHWSPDGMWLAYVEPVGDDARITGELFGIQPGTTEPVQWTDFAAAYGAARINGIAVGDLAWSPDSQRIAFWVTEVTGADPLANTGNAMIHVLDLSTNEITAYCGYSTPDATPNPPRLSWSPDGRYLGFGGDVREDGRSYLLLALEVETGVYTALSEGLFPAFGAPDVVAWGLPPG